MTMQTQFLLIAVILIGNGDVFSSISAEKLICTDPNTILSSNAPTADCAPTCSNKDCTSLKLCEQSFKKGCVCKQGYVLNSSGICIPINHCPIKCIDKNAVFSTNGPAKNCTRTCANKDSTLPAYCKQNNTVGCFCKPGYVLNSQEICVPSITCKKICPKPQFIILRCPDPNAVFSSNGPPHNCTRTCLNKDSELPQSCKTECPGVGCFCKPDFVLNANNTCIPSNLCPPICPKNEIFDHCASLCQTLCSTLGASCIAKACIGRCRCIDGYARDAHGVCIPIKKCPTPVCGANEEFSECGCMSPCDQPIASCTKKTCTRGCFCKKGYLKDRITNMCVKKHQCKKCPGDTAFDECPIQCPETCEFINNCKQQFPCVPGCYCRTGYIRLPNSTCVKSEDYCPKICKKSVSTFFNCPASQNSPKSLPPIQNV